MTEPPPLPQSSQLNYQPQGTGVPDAHGSAPQTILRFFIGLIAGSVVSAIVWIAGWKLMMAHNADALIWIVPAVKLFVGITLICLRGWRSMGAGILVSVALGVLIFFGACAVNMDWSKMH